MTVTQLPGAAYSPGDPSPCCGDDDERLFPSPWLPGWLVCSCCGEKYPVVSP